MMKVYFHCSISDLEQNKKEYLAIIKIIEYLGEKVATKLSLGYKVESLSKNDIKRVSKNISKQKDMIKNSDIVIFELTRPSVGSGYLMSFALGQHKSVLALYRGSIHPILLGERNRLLTSIKYSVEDHSNLKKQIGSYIKKAREKMLKYRFNMMLDKCLYDLLSLESG